MADEEDYEYEYIELEEGEELPEGAEYEYVEVPYDEEDEVSSEDSAEKTSSFLDDAVAGVEDFDLPFDADADEFTMNIVEMPPRKPKTLHKVEDVPGIDELLETRVLASETSPETQAAELELSSADVGASGMPALGDEAENINMPGSTAQPDIVEDEMPSFQAPSDSYEEEYEETIIVEPEGDEEDDEEEEEEEEVAELEPVVEEEVLQEPEEADEEIEVNRNFDNILGGGKPIDDILNDILDGKDDVEDINMAEINIEPDIEEVEPVIEEVSFEEEVQPEESASDMPLSSEQLLAMAKNNTQEVSEELELPDLEDISLPEIELEEEPLLETTIDEPNEQAQDDIIEFSEEMEAEPTLDDNAPEEQAQEDIVDFSEEIEAEPTLDDNIPEEQAQEDIVEFSEEMEETPSSPVVNNADVSAINYKISELVREDVGNAQRFDKNSRVKFFQGDKNSESIYLFVEDIEKAAQWNVVLFDKKIMSVSSETKEINIPRSPNVGRYTRVIKAGDDKLEMFNEERYRFMVPTEEFVRVKGYFIYGNIEDNSGLIVDDYVTIPLVGVYNKEISFGGKAVSGIIAGPEGTLIYFSEVEKILVG